MERPPARTVAGRTTDLSEPPVVAEAGRTVPQVAVRWLLQQPGVTAPIIGPRTPAYLTTCSARSAGNSPGNRWIASTSRAGR
ncbi:aldo/keto reductase [Microlunatus parietis]|uniref:aldo/keto reductase n=1 Tax=Microlunatus parietis TaxID=682979 RepID=UPI001C548483